MRNSKNATKITRIWSRRDRMKQILFSRLAIAAFVISTSASMAWAQAEPLRIGAINPYSGPMTLYGDEVARGYQLAIDEANAKGGVVGRKIELLRGDAGSPPQGIAAVEKMAGEGKVEVFVGTYIRAG